MDRLPRDARLRPRHGGLGLAGRGDRRLLDPAHGRLPRRRHLVAHHRPRVAQDRVHGHGARAPGPARPARLGGRADRRGPADPGRDLREQGGPAGHPGPRGGGRQRRRRSLRPRRRRARLRHRRARHPPLHQHRVALRRRGHGPLDRVPHRGPQGSRTSWRAAASGSGSSRSPSSAGATRWRSSWGRGSPATAPSTWRT